ncbi:MAG: hypothetical protein GWN56_15675, partial [Nitrosopumilaceae archaeon]|nr:hypothetical protein [Nitrosopumilaceae archaeon]NIV66787.1 hypothetical protein [Nitrosopumilaceae archaeon]
LGIILASLVGFILLILAFTNKKEKPIEIDLDTPSLEKDVTIQKKVERNINTSTIIV